MPDKKVVVVTGCTKGGIGNAMCKEFAKRGCRVFATARRLEAMDGLEELGIEKVILDVTDVKSISSAAESITAATGGCIDILVNNAGIGGSAPILDTPLDAFRQVLETNTTSVVAMTQAFAPFMIARRSGKIVNVSSIAAIASVPYRGAYVASKCALSGLSDVMRMELKPFGIEVVVLLPGAVKTNMVENYKISGLLKLPEDSYYGPVRDVFTEKLNLSQGLDSTSVEDFATYNVSKILSRRTPYYILSAANSGIAWFISTFFPRWLSDWFYMRFFALDKLKTIKSQ